MIMKRKSDKLFAATAWMLLACCVLLVSSCKHRSGAVVDKDSSAVTGAQTGGLAGKAVNMINAGRQTEKYITAKASVKLMAGQKDVGVSGTLRMKRDDVIQLSLAFLGLMEVGRMEITPDYFLLVDRVNHQYVRVAYSDVPFFRQSGIDFHTFQSLFWGELFLPGDGGSVPDGKDFEQRISGDTLQLTSAVHARAALRFVASMSRALLLQTSVTSGDSSMSPLMSWDYSSYKSYGGKQFPTSMQMHISSGNVKAQVILNLSSLKNNSDWQTRTEINTKKYSPVSVESIMKRLKGLSL